jgi:hypothetical protein
MGISKIEKWIGIVAILLIGLIHVVQAPAELGEAPYFGLMFVGNGVGAVVAAFGILRGARLWGWELGLFIAVGSLVGYVISRTVGLPRMEVEEGLQPLVILSFALEVVFIALYVWCRRSQGAVAPSSGRAGVEAS